jgi:hypothetical protein
MGLQFTPKFHRKGRRERKGQTCVSKSEPYDCPESAGPSRMPAPQTEKYQGILCVLCVLCGSIALSGFLGIRAAIDDIR